jgi:hypothetical protein
MATRKRMGFRPRKATKRMGGKANKRTRKNVMTGGSSKPPAPPPPQQQKTTAPKVNRSGLFAEIQKGGESGFMLKSVKSNKSAPQPKQGTIKPATRWAPVNTSTGAPTKGASGMVNTSSMGEGYKGADKHTRSTY